MLHVPDHVLVIMDEAYFEFAQSYPNYPDSMRYRMDNVITLRTFSKAYGLAGFRVGYGMAHEELIGHLFKVKPPFDPSSPSQAAAVAAMRDTEFLEQSLSIVEQGKRRCYALFDELKLPYIRSASNSVLLLFEDENRAAAFTLAMLKRGVILRHLPAFGIKEGVRVTIGLHEEMNHFEESLRDVLDLGF
jgi:histidinol-phosphate aminotransferase